MESPRLTEDDLQALRTVLRRIISLHNESLREAAKAIDWAPSALSEVLNGKRGAGMKLLTKLSQYLGQPIEVILGRRSIESTEGPSLAGLRSLVTVPGFAESRAAIEASGEHSGRPMPAEVLDAAGRAAFNPPPARITPEYLRFVCEAIIQGRADDWQDRVSTTPPPATDTKGQKSKPKLRD